MSEVARFRTGYMDDALFNLEAVLDQAEMDLADVDFDTLVGTGFSGGIVVPALALRMGKNFLLIRKDSDDTHHSGNVMGRLGDRWIFVDDFIQRGTTKRRVMARIDEITTDGWPNYNAVTSAYVGDYLYARDEKWRPAAEDESMVEQDMGVSGNPEPNPDATDSTTGLVSLVELYEQGATFYMDEFLWCMNGGMTTQLRKQRDAMLAENNGRPPGVPLFTTDGVSIRLPKEISGEL